MNEGDPLPARRWKPHHGHGRRHLHPGVKQELARHYGFLYAPEQLKAKMERAGVSTLDALIDHDCAPSPRGLIPQAKDLAPMDAWRE